MRIFVAELTISDKNPPLETKKHFRAQIYPLICAHCAQMQLSRVYLSQIYILTAKASK